MQDSGGAGGDGRRAVFLDRDGTINTEVDFLGDPDKCVLEEGSAEGLAMLASAGFLLVVVSNQSGVARGYFPEEDVVAVNARLSELLRAEGVELEHYYYCPHHPEAELDEYRLACRCRKPSPGLMERAALELGIDLDRSYAVGDSKRDLEAGRKVGARTALVLTGHTGREDIGEWNFRPDHVAGNLLEACRWILEDSAAGEHVSDGGAGTD